MQITRESKVSGGKGVSWGAEHRDGDCSECGSPLEIPTKEDKAEYHETRLLKRMCPQCGERRAGKLIVRQISITPPEAPKCLRPSCLWDYLWAAWLYALVASYHARRVAYAEANRHKKILERYRTGEPAPQTMWQAIHANIKLACPVCRKYNADPLLFRR